MKAKAPTEVIFKHSGSQKDFHLSTYLLSHVPDDGATVECSTLVLLQIQLAILCFHSLKVAEGKEWGKG